MEYNLNKEILISTILRLHPSTQPIRNRVVEKIIASLFLDKPRLSTAEIQRILEDKFNIHFTISEIKTIIMESTLFKINEDGFYQLSSDFEAEIKHIENETKRKYKKVIQNIFGDVKIDIYIDPFLEFLSKIFLKISEEYVKQLKGETELNDLVGRKYFEATMEDILNKYKNIDNERFEIGIKKFFTYSDPDYDYIKWNMAQSYYLLKVLGLDPTGYLISEEKFKDGIYYLDTNLLIAYIFGNHIHHLSAKYLLNAINKLNGIIKVAYITIEELSSWIEYKISILEKTYEFIPENIRITDALLLEFEEYCKNKNYDESVFQGFREYIKNKIALLKSEFKIVDDDYFDDVQSDEYTKKLILTLKYKYLQLRHEQKSDKAALHDALILQWIKKEREITNNSKIWLLTLDTTLPHTLYQEKNTISITLDTYLQWISPIIDGTSIEEIYSFLIKNRFFPPEKVFDLKDFLIFHELEIRTRDLPPEDVKEAIIYLKNKFGKIDLSDPKAFSEISYELARFFADPSRKYQQEIRKAYEEQEKLKKYYEEKLGMLKEKVEEIENAYKIKLDEKDKELKEKELAISNIQKRLEELEEDRKLEKIKKSAMKRFVVVVFLTLGIETIIMYAISIYGAGMNLFQKLTNSWPWLTLGIPIFIFSGWLIIGKKRLISLGWPFNKIFKMEEK